MIGPTRKINDFDHFINANQPPIFAPPALSNRTHSPRNLTANYQSNNPTYNNYANYLNTNSNFHSNIPPTSDKSPRNLYLNIYSAPPTASPIPANRWSVLYALRDTLSPSATIQSPFLMVLIMIVLVLTLTIPTNVHSSVSVSMTNRCCIAECVQLSWQVRAFLCVLCLLGMCLVWLVVRRERCRFILSTRETNVTSR
jgi:hypothetical protein